MIASPSIAARFASHFWLKAIVTPIFMTVFFILYFAILRHPMRPPFEIPFIKLDHWIGFQPWTVVPYLTLWIYVSLPSALSIKLRDLIVHACGAAVLSAIGLIIFAVWPTSTPSSNIDWSMHPGIRFLKNVDASGNACPSLHAAFAVFACMWFARVLREMNVPRWTHALNIAWSIAILYSTVATRQHVVLDTISGAALGWLIGRLSLICCAKPSSLSARPPIPSS